MVVCRRNIVGFLTQHPSSILSDTGPSLPLSCHSLINTESVFPASADTNHTPSLYHPTRSTQPLHSASLAQDPPHLIALSFSQKQRERLPWQPLPTHQRRPPSDYKKKPTVH